MKTEFFKKKFSKRVTFKGLLSLCYTPWNELLKIEASI